MDILVIPDSHNRPETNNPRWRWLAHLVAHRRPDVIINLGDHWDNPSLSSYDTGKASFEGRRYEDDLNSGVLAFQTFESVYREKVRKGHRPYNPQKHFLLGNHEERADRAGDNDPKLKGFIGTHVYANLVKKWGWTPHKFLTAVEVAGIFFAHYFVSGLMNRPIGGENPATTILNKQHRSCVAGHSHVYDYSERTDVSGRKLQALVAGCFVDPSFRFSYAHPSQDLWRNGVTYLHAAKDGNFDPELVSLDRLKNLHS